MKYQPVFSQAEKLNFLIYPIFFCAIFPPPIFYFFIMCELSRRCRGHPPVSVVEIKTLIFSTGGIRFFLCFLSNFQSKIRIRCVIAQPVYCIYIMHTELFVTLRILFRITVEYLYLLSSAFDDLFLLHVIPLLFFLSSE